jgi:hypothetical protein
VKVCPGCDYLVPSAWDACERCGTALDDAVPVEPLVTAAATRMRGARPELRSHYGGESGREWDVDAPPPARRSARLDRIWTGDDENARRRWRLPIIGPIAVAVAVVSMFLAWNRFTHPPVPKVLRPWAEHGAGVQLVPPGVGFKLRLPASPTVAGTQVTIGPGLEGGAEVAMSRVGPYEIGAVWLSVPDGTLNVAGSDPLTVAGDLAGRAGSFHIEVPDTAIQDKLPALKAEVTHEAQEGDALVVVRGTWIYAVVISGPGDLDTAFTALRKAFSLT